VTAYSDGEVRLTLRRSPDGFGGTLEVGGAVYRVSGPPPAEGKAFKGEFWRADERHEFTAAIAKDGGLVLTSGGEVYELSRQAPLAPPPDPEAPASRPNPRPANQALHKVKVGQRYHFHMEPAPGTELDMIWQVDELIGNRELKYSLTTILNGKPVGPPTTMTWAIPPAVDNVLPDPNFKPPAIETIKAAGRTWSCFRVESAGTTTWCPQKDGISVWPPFIRQTRDGKVISELVKIEEPRGR
jgi:hypothetical protein